jgi:ubiquinone/menaquinone biosynthesis C-methylase UbiE
VNPAPGRADTAADALERALPLLLDEPREGGVRTSAGYLDLLNAGDEPASTGPIQDLMLSRVVPAVYERWWRPALGRVFKGAFGPGMRDEHRIARLLLSLCPGDGVLDLACGTGNFSRDFGHTVGSEGLVVGIDVSRTMLERAVRDTDRAGLDQVAFVRGDAQNLPFRAHTFDAVCCFAALHLFADPEHALDRMTAVLTPGGRIALFTTAGYRSAAARLAEPALARRSGARLFEREELADALRHRGFGEIRQRVGGITQFIGGRLE